MSKFTLELERKLQTLPPDAAAHLERAVREILKLIPKNRVADQGLPVKRYVTQARPLGIKVGNGSHKWTEWLDEAEGAGWK
jgi:hypothetical protein